MMSMSTVWRGLAIVIFAAAMIWAWSFVLPKFSDDQGESEASPTGETATWTVTHIYDGDSMVVERDGVEEDVRVIGIDTPERGECGADEAREAAEVTLLDQQVTLVSGAQTDRDSYDRLLRYVEVGGDDYGREMIAFGFAIARYDSRTDQPHDREDDYRELDAEVMHICPEFDSAAS